MKKNRKKLLIYFLAIALTVTTVAYALVQTTLTVTGTTTKKGGSFNIYLKNLSSPTITGNASVSSVNLQATSLNFNVSLSEPLDSVVYYFDVTNQGTINAALSSAILSGVDNAKAHNVTFTVSNADGTSLATGSTLTVGQTKHLRLSISYDDVDYISATDVSLPVGITLIYQQIDTNTAPL